MENIIIIAVLTAIVAGIAFYLYRAKKRGQTCIGCQYAKECAKRCGGACEKKQEESEG